MRISDWSSDVCSSDLFRLGNQNRNTGNKESILVWQVEFEVQGGDPGYKFERAWGPILEQLVDSDGKKAILPSDTLGRGRSEERRVGKECVSTCRSRWSQYH